jgi:signal transduction histidine kinase/ActR/RegA family two-component response regulator
VLPHDTAAALDTNNRRVLSERDSIEFEELISESDGEHVYSSIKAPLFDASDNPDGIVAVSTDITERKRLEHALREADRRKNEFLATLAHELRNPLAPVRYALQVISLKGPNTPQVNWAVELIERQTKYMSRLIDDLLDVSRISRNTLRLRRERIELSEVINSALETSRPLIESSGQELIVNLPPQAVYLDGDVVRLAQVFSNLLNNAAKYGKGPQEKGSIHLNAERKDNCVTVAIKDKGIGIAPAMLPRIFEMFTQAARTVEQFEGGLGIGLSLSRQLVEMHGGVIEARSEGLGKGSEFSVTLPTAISSARPSSEVPKGSLASSPPKRRILIADDNADVSEAFAIMLETLGHDVEIATNGVEAVGKADQFRPEIIVLDIGMPGINGYGAARLIREKEWGKKVVLVAITGWGNESDKRLSQEAGFNAHLVKPVDPVELSQLLESLVTATPAGSRSR